MNKLCGYFFSVLLLTIMVCAGCALPVDPNTQGSGTSQQPSNTNTSSTAQPNPTENSEATDSEDTSTEDETLPSGDPVNGATLFRTPQVTTFPTVFVACADCHGQDGEGANAPSLRGLSAILLTNSALGSTRHPAPVGRQDVKFPELSPQDFRDMAAFLK